MGKETKTGEKLIKYGLIVSSFCCTALIADSIYDNMGGKVLTGRKVKINEDATVYSNITDLINEQNGKDSYYDSSYDRLVISTFYKLDGQLIRVDMKGDYKAKEQRIIDQNGVLIGVITTIDFENKIPEAFYKIEDFKRQQQKVKKIKKIKK